MADNKRKSQGDDAKRKKKYRSDGTPVWGKRHVEGPGVWVSCVKGKEKQTVGEIYELFESIGSELWPLDTSNGKNSGDGDDNDDEDEDDGLSLEEQIAKELSAMKRPRSDNHKQRFTNCQTNTPCVIFISTKPPVDPVELVVKYVHDVQNTGVTRTRHVHRLVPVSGSCVANIPEIQALCRRVLQEYFDKHPDTKFKYKIEMRVRNHTTIPRPTMIQTIAQCVPEGHTVDLQNPEIFILVEVFKSICGISVVKDYYSLAKFNVLEIASKTRKDKADAGADALNSPGLAAAESRLHQKLPTSPTSAQESETKRGGTAEEAVVKLEEEADVPSTSTTSSTVGGVTATVK